MYRKGYYSFIIQDFVEMLVFSFPERTRHELELTAICSTVGDGNRGSARRQRPIFERFGRPTLRPTEG